MQTGLATLILALAGPTSAYQLIAETAGPFTGCGLSVTSSQIATSWENAGKEVQFETDHGSYNRAAAAEYKCAGQPDQFWFLGSVKDKKTGGSTLYLINCTKNGSACCGPSLGKVTIAGKDDGGSTVYTWNNC